MNITQQQNHCLSCTAQEHRNGNVPKICDHKNTPDMSRRTFLGTLTAAGFLAGIPLLSTSGLFFPANKLKRWNWNGYAMGTQVSLTICHEDRTRAEALTRLCTEEIKRLESIFTLYRPDSQLVQLNQDGVLYNPAPEMVELVSLAKRYGDLTGGMFNMALQPLWEIIRKEGFSASKIEKALELTDYRKISVSPQKIAFGSIGMGISLNGIAQGFITDKIATFMKNNGIGNALINLGEIRAMGTTEQKKPWQVGIHDPRQNEDSYFTKLDLNDRSLSTTGGYGLPLSADGKKHHVFNPQTGQSENRYLSLSVVADTATKADALSTAFYLMPVDRIRQTLIKFPEAGVILMNDNGQVETLGKIL